MNVTSSHSQQENMALTQHGGQDPEQPDVKVKLVECSVDTDCTTQYGNPGYKCDKITSTCKPTRHMHQPKRLRNVKRFWRFIV
jgi:hypothetical protein